MIYFHPKPMTLPSPFLSDLGKGKAECESPDFFDY